MDDMSPEKIIDIYNHQLSRIIMVLRYPDE